MPITVSFCDHIVTSLPERHEKDMKPKIVESFEPVTLVGGGPAIKKDLDASLEIAPRAVAADSGAATLLRFSIRPEAVIGDFDSLPPEIAAQLQRASMHRITEQSSTDFDKAVRSIAAPVIIGVGFMGARVDHQLAALNVMVRRPDQPIVLISETEVIWHVPRRITLDVRPGETVSLMPFAQVSGRSSGLEWPIDGIKFEPDGLIGTSNRATGPVDLAMDGPGMIAFIPRPRLAGLVKALCDLAPDARWSARA